MEISRRRFEIVLMLRLIINAVVIVALTLVAYGMLTTLFWLNCHLGGHSTLEWLSGEFASYVFAIAIGLMELCRLNAGIDRPTNGSRG